ncbi:STAS/SEC14 domain-containing protein [Paracoccus sp. Z330]|uniref:STAS/SEC14 domain-containing protein n=1 Tax=Paracoccus onchidii TaxID=3017813 RepID=A0ABT4ZH21_9RHOB|nr:STAS/SEC14 domain-containing protein [Paracoccus onchidii]MDB6178657.1 STAS/SEC14 domain-containing protein [Paracoccus onchidii]
MLNIHVDAKRNIITAQPEGVIPASEFEAMGHAIDDYANEHDRMPGLVIHLKGLPHWQGLSAMRAHFEMVREHGVVLPRVAIVTDSKGLAVLPNVADIFVRARVRHFDLRQEAEAVDWAGSAEQEPEGYVLIDGFPDNVVAIRAVGEVTSRDYEDRLIPLVRKKAKAHGKVRLMMQLGHDFEKYSVGAMWDDARLGLTNWRSFERIAIVSDIGWITRSIKMFAPLMPSEVAVFPDDGLEAASAWICEGNATPAPNDAGPSEAPKQAASKPAAKRTPRTTGRKAATEARQTAPAAKAPAAKARVGEAPSTATSKAETSDTATRSSAPRSARARTAAKPAAATKASPAKTTVPRTRRSTTAKTQASAPEKTTATPVRSRRKPTTAKQPGSTPPKSES